jgi:acetoin utilization protein AcuB
MNAHPEFVVEAAQRNDSAAVGGWRGSAGSADCAGRFASLAERLPSVLILPALVRAWRLLYSGAMSPTIPIIQAYMSPSPHTIGADQTIGTARRVLREFKIRHLPVLRGSELVGMLTERDVALIEGLDDVDPAQLTVEEAMSVGLYAVAPTTPIDEVAREMAAKKYGSAIVVRNHKVVGVFTTVDACRALSDLLCGQPSS